MPIQNLIDYLEGGDSIHEFLEDFPSVSRQQVISFLEEAKDERARARNVTRPPNPISSRLMDLRGRCSR